MNLVAMLLFAAAVSYGLARWLRLPSLPLLIGAGMALNLAGFLPDGFELGGGKDEEHAGAALGVLEFGLLFLVFASGVELNPRRFSKQRSIVGWVGCAQFVVSSLLGYIFSRWMGLGNLESLYLCFGLAASSTLVVLRQVRLRQAMFEPFGRVITGVLLLQDVLLITVIVVLSRMTEGLLAMGLGLGEAVLLGATAWVAQRHLIPQLVKRTKPDEESLLLWLVAVLFLFVGVASVLGLPLITGAFAGGFAFSAFPLNGLVRAQLSSLSDFFQALFFVALGALVGIPDVEQWWMALQFSAVVIVLTPPLVAAIAEWRGMSARASIETGLLLAQTSEFSLLLGVSGLVLGHLSPEIFGMIALTAIITMTLTPYIGREKSARALLRLHPFRRRPAGDSPHTGHVLLLGFGSAGMWTLKPLRAQGENVLVIDDDAVVCAELERRGISVLRGDGSEHVVLKKAGANQAKLVIASMRRTGDALKVLEYVRDVPVVVRVFEEHEATKIRAAGGIPVLNSHASAETFVEWFAADGRMKSAVESESQEV